MTSPLGGGDFELPDVPGPDTPGPDVFGLGASEPEPPALVGIRDTSTFRASPTFPHRRG